MRIRVFLHVDGNRRPASPADMPAVEAWYKERLIGTALVQYVRDNVLALTYVGPKSIDTESMLRDPDDDGNYPLGDALVQGVKTR